MTTSLAVTTTVLGKLYLMDVSFVEVALAAKVVPAVRLAVVKRDSL